MPRTSAGLLPYRRRDGRLEVFLVHPGGPFWANKEEHAWSVAKGEIERGEDLLDAAHREFFEETGIKCEIVRLVGVYTNPRHVMHYTSNDEVRQECSLVFAARPVGGERKTSSESREVLWVEPDELDGYPMHESMRQRVQHLLERRDAPFIG